MEFKNDYVLGFIICEIFTVITLQDWVGWGIFTVILGYPGRVIGDSQHLESKTLCPEDPDFYTVLALDTQKAQNKSSILMLLLLNNAGSCLAKNGSMPIWQYPATTISFGSSR